jgi:hypothetical protein
MVKKCAQMVRGENGRDRNCKNLVHGNSDYCIRHGGRYSSEEEEKGSYNQEEEDWRRRNASPPRRQEEENYYQEDDYNGLYHKLASLARRRPVSSPPRQRVGDYSWLSDVSKRNLHKFPRVRAAIDSGDMDPPRTGCGLDEQYIIQLEGDVNTRPLIPRDKEGRGFGTGYEDILDGYIIVGSLGQGSYGAIFKLWKNGGVARAIKFQRLTTMKKVDDFQNEIDHLASISSQSTLTTEFYKSKIYNYNGETIGVFTMEKVSGDLLDILIKDVPDDFIDFIVYSIGALLLKLCKYGYIHGDFHWGNIAFNAVYGENNEYACTLKIIDWGFADKKKCFPCIEISQMMRTIYPVFPGKKVNSYNRQRLIPGLQILWESFNCGKFEVGFDYWESKYVRLQTDAYSNRYDDASSCTIS